MTTQAVMGGVFLWQKCPSNESIAGRIFSCGKKVLDLPILFYAMLSFLLMAAINYTACSWTCSMSEISLLLR